VHEGRTRYASLGQSVQSDREEEQQNPRRWAPISRKSLYSGVRDWVSQQCGMEITECEEQDEIEELVLRE
jgi:hypothetical protein